MNNPNLQGWTVLRVWRGAIYLRVPTDLQTPIPYGCDCTYCKAHPKEIPAWDTLAIVAKAGERSWTVHAPEWQVTDTPRS